jgi:aminomethyltransferase
MKRTALFNNHVALGARMAEFAGWEMPIEYDGIVPEHLHTRSAVSIFDTCHMGEFDLCGARAEADLERLVTQRVSTIAVGQCRYGYLLNPDGGVLDDLTVFRRSADHFFLVVNAGTLESDAAWIQAHLSSGTTFTDLSPGRAKLDVQGPASRTEMEKALGHALPELKYFRFVDTVLGGLPCTLSRTGYTGEWGYEIYFSIDEAVALWERLTETTAIRPSGIGARDTLRLEVGYPLYGHELNSSMTPVAAAAGHFIDTEKEFIGREAVLRDLQDTGAGTLSGIQLESRRAAREGSRVLIDGVECGTVTSGKLAPSLGVAVAMAYIDAASCVPGAAVQVEITGTRKSTLVPGSIVTLPFYKDGTARRRSNIRR